MFLWGQDFERDIAGLDILGLRRLDQNLEARLVNGITTISQRARYFTILPWAIGEFFADESASGATTFDETRFRGHLGRVEFLVLAATVADPIESDASGLLGPVTFSSDMNALRTGQDIAFPVDHADTMLNTYLGPCRAIGILKDAPRGSPVPIELTPRGQQLWAARNAAITNADMVKAVIRDGDSLGRELCIDLADLFSLKRLDRGSEEARLLREALTKEWRSDPSASDAYPRFNGTVELLRASTAPRPLRAERFLADRYLEAVRGDVHDPIWLAWAEYEWRPPAPRLGDAFRRGLYDVAGIRRGEHRRDRRGLEARAQRAEACQANSSSAPSFLNPPSPVSGRANASFSRSP